MERLNVCKNVFRSNNTDQEIKRNQDKQKEKKSPIT